MEERRPNPDALLAQAAGEGRGKLKLFLGSAPGVGKTCEMLVQAHRRLQAGEDVLAGVVETHGRAGTQAELRGMPQLALREVPYRHRVLYEFDPDAALVRRPRLLLVDELAHTNAPGSRHAKRWEDVEELLAAGQDVWATLNVQHLESLNDDVARITGVRVAETVPDRVLERADEIELIDLPPAELRARLREGKIYRADNAARALDGFFREGNLAALREIALRRAAQHVDDDLRGWMRRSGVDGPWPAAERVLVLVGPGMGEGVVRHAKRLAEALHAPWTALHVERDNTVAQARPAMALAAQLGADVQARIGTDLVRTAMELAREINATHLVVGRSPAPWWRRLTGRVLGVQLLRRAGDFVVHAVPVPGARASLRRPAMPEGWAAWAVAGGLPAAVTGGGVLAHGVVPGDSMGLAYLAAVVVAASAGGLRASLLAATIGFLAWDFFFIEPLFTLTIANLHDVMALTVFVVVAALSGSLAGRVRAQGRAAQARMEGLRRVGTFSRTLGEAATEPDLLVEIARQAAGVAGEAAVFAPAAEGLVLRAAEPAAPGLDEGAWAAARWTSAKGEASGQGTATLPAAGWRFLPLRTVRGRLGVLGVRSPAALNEPQLQSLGALADQAALAWERVKLAGESARAAAMEETQRLRGALLASLGHDLRTPLTAIRGAAGTLRTSWSQLTEAVRADLLDTIEEDVTRMTRFLANVTELTRLESGQVVTRLQPVGLGEAAEAAASRLAGETFVSVQMDTPEPVALADATLLERVLENLLENAVKYSPAHSLVALTCRLEGAEAVLRVADEGIGIAAEDLPYVFDSFFRAGRGDRVAPGTGLGLAIAKGFVAAMGGTIEAQSPRLDLPRDGAPGTVITLRLPVPA